MSVSELKNALHSAIDAIDNKEQLEAIFAIIKSGDEHALSDDEIRILEERHRKYLSGEEKTISLDELKRNIREKYGF